MKEIKDQSFGGERPLFAIHDTRLVNVTITEGESGIKHCSDIEAIGCTFIANIRSGTLTAHSSKTVSSSRAHVRK